VQPLALAASAPRLAPRGTDRIDLLPLRPSDPEGGRGRARAGSADPIEILDPRPVDRDGFRGRTRQGLPDRTDGLRQRFPERETVRVIDHGALDDAAIRHDRLYPRRLAPAIPAPFLTQFLAQRDPGVAAHLEDWPGARGAYARADRLSASGPRGLSIIL
jgi:hypothetical protein